MGEAEDSRVFVKYLEGAQGRLNISVRHLYRRSHL